MLRKLFQRRARLPPVPLANSYWVRAGRLLAGEYPIVADAAESMQRLAALRAAGIERFLDLTQAHELRDYRQLLSPGVTHRRHAVADMEVPDSDAHMVAIQREIRAALDAGSGLYVHCRAGIGRTGTVIGCYLVDEGLDGERALRELNALWRQSARSKSWRKVPQTPEQALYIREWALRRANVETHVTI